MNLGLLGFLYYWGVQAHAERQEELRLLYQNRKEVADLLYRCYPAPPDYPFPRAQPGGAKPGGG